MLHFFNNENNKMDILIMIMIKMDTLSINMDGQIKHDDETGSTVSFYVNDDEYMYNTHRETSCVFINLEKKFNFSFFFLFSDEKKCLEIFTKFPRRCSVDKTHTHTETDTPFIDNK